MYKQLESEDNKTDQDKSEKYVDLHQQFLESYIFEKER